MTQTPRIAQTSMNLLMLVLFVLLALASVKSFSMTGSIRSLGILVVNTLFVVLYLRRKPAISEAQEPSAWVLGFLGSTVPLFMRPTESGGFPELGTALQIVGLVLLVIALLSLRRSFAVVAANRGVRVGGLYRVVRHPIYFAELLVIGGVALANPSTLNVGIFITECALQFARAQAEERLLSSDPAYVAYQGKVRYRLIPGVI